MTLRIISAVTLVAFFNTILGCSKVVNLTVAEATTHPPNSISAVALRSTHPFIIKLDDVASVNIMRVRRASEGGSVFDTLTGDGLRDEVIAYMAMKIVGVTLKSGEKISLDERDCYYDVYADVVQVAGTEIVFDSLGGSVDFHTGVITGRAVDGTPVDVKIDDVAYVRARMPDHTATLLLVTGIVAGVLTVGAIGIALYASAMGD